MAPYLASAFGVFLMRQTFRTIPREFEEAALIDGASRLRSHPARLLPLARPAVVAFAIVSVTAHWNEFLWPLMVINSPSKRRSDRRARDASPRAPRRARTGASSPPARCSSLRRCWSRSCCSSAVRRQLHVFRHQMKE